MQNQNQMDDQVLRRDSEATSAGARQSGGMTTSLMIAGALAVLVAIGCAPMQQVPVTLGPEPVEVYVDGERVIEPVPPELELQSDRAHVIFVKKPGHRAEQLILRSVDQDDGPPRLEPAQVVIELRRETPKGRRLEVELDDPDSAGADGSPAAPGTPAP